MYQDGWICATDSQVHAKFLSCCAKPIGVLETAMSTISLAVALACIAVAAAATSTPKSFYTVKDTQKWRKYYAPAENRCVLWLSPVASVSCVVIPRLACSTFFGEDHVPSTKKLYVSAGMEHTGAVHLQTALAAAAIPTVMHAAPATRLPAIAYGRTQTPDALNNFTDIFNNTSLAEEPTVALLDFPVGEFVWDLMHAFPDSRVAVTVMPVRFA